MTASVLKRDPHAKKKRFKRTLIYFNTDTQYAHFYGKKQQQQQLTAEFDRAEVTFCGYLDLKIQSVCATKPFVFCFAFRVFCFVFFSSFLGVWGRGVVVINNLFSISGFCPGVGSMPESAVSLKAVMRAPSLHHQRH